MVDEGTVVALIKRTNELLEVLVKLQLGDVLKNELADPKRRQLYELTGGNLARPAISAKVGMSGGAISGHWQRWEQLGLLIKDSKSYRKVLS
jgi:hypothetical protein